MKFLRYTPYLGPFVLLSLVLVLSSCSENKERKISDYDQANEFVENGNYQSAIVLMEDQLQKRPSDTKARAILASAYAARAGISVRSYIDLAQEIMDSSSTKDSLYDQRRAAVFERLRAGASKSQKDFIDTLAEFNRALWKISDIIVKFEKIPRIESKEQYKDIQQAVRVLDTEPALTGGAAVYSGLLRLVLFRYHMDHYYRFPEVKDCQVDISELHVKVSELRVEMNLVFLDFERGISNPKRSEKVGEFAAEVDESFSKALTKLSKYSKGGEPADLSLFLMPFGVECE